MSSDVDRRCRVASLIGRLALSPLGAELYGEAEDLALHHAGERARSGQVVDYPGLQAQRIDAFVALLEEAASKIDEAQERALAEPTKDAL